MREYRSADIEKILRDYFRKLNEVTLKKQLLGMLDQNMNDVKRTLIYAYDLVPGKEAAQKFKFASSMRQFNYFLIGSSRRQIKLKIQIMYLEAEVEGISFALGLLEPVDRVICEGSYGVQTKSNVRIGSELKMDEKTIRYRRKKIIAGLTQVLKLDPGIPSLKRNK